MLPDDDACPGLMIYALHGKRIKRVAFLLARSHFYCVKVCNVQFVQSDSGESTGE